MTFGDRLRAERKMRGLTQAGLARLTGQTSMNVWRYEHGKQGPLSSGAKDMADALGIRPVDLLIDGPPFVEVEFAIGEGNLPPSPLLERRAMSMLPGGSEGGRVGVWPWVDDGRLRFRCRPACIASICQMAGMMLPWSDERLGPPTVKPVDPAPDLVVLVSADDYTGACREVAKRSHAVDCDPSIDATRRSHLWLATLRRVPSVASMALQQIPQSAPIGLFAPAVVAV